MASMSVQELRRLAEEFVAAEPGRLGQAGWWRKPLPAAAPVDARFDALPRIAAADHLLPRDLLPTGRSVVVFFIPFKKDLPRENRAGLAYFSDLPESTHVCGKCAAVMPCSFANPVARLESASR